MSSLLRLRDQAYTRQKGRCCYCGIPMLLSGNGPRRCTAEHLTAQCDSGRDTAANIAAACCFCNGRRHRAKRPLGPQAFRAYVLKRLAEGKWNACLWSDVDGLTIASVERLARTAASPT